MRWASAKCKPQYGAAWSGMARLGGQGSARHGEARQGPQTVARRGLPSLPSSWMDMARRGLARRGQAWHGDARPGSATADDLSTEPFGALCWVLRNPVLAWRAEAWFGSAGHGTARHGRASQGNTGSRHQPAAPLDCSGTGPSDVFRLPPLRPANRQTRRHQS